VNRGEISIFKVLDDHSHLSVAKIPPGGFFGEVAIVNETVRSAGSQATVFSELYILEKELLTDLLVDFPEFENTIKSHIEELRLLHVRRDTAKVAPSADQIKMLQDYAADQERRKVENKMIPPLIGWSKVGKANGDEPDSADLSIRTDSSEESWS